MRLGCLIVCTRGSALLPSLPSSRALALPSSRALAPPSSLAPAARAGEPGTLRGGRGARADRRAGRPRRAARSGKLGRTAAAVCPAPQSEWRLLRSRPRASGGGGETRRAPFAPRSPLLTFGEAGRPAPGPRAGEACVCVWGNPTGGLGLRRRRFRVGLGSSWAARLRFGAGFPVTVSQCFPACSWSLAVRGHPGQPAPRPVLSAASAARSGKPSQLERVARWWIRPGLPGPRVPRVPGHQHSSTDSPSDNLRGSLGACFPALSSNRTRACRGLGE